MIYLTLEELLYVAERAIGAPVELRDAGLLEAAAARPRASAFGADAYPDLHAKTAALLLSICLNHALIDGNKRLALAGAIAMIGVNGWHLTLTNNEAYELVLSVATGAMSTVDEVADVLRRGSQHR
ncbi:MAG: type II toxin-antitoxin system death-on-curing family toxin [Actinobacteria bacterium]|nr:type II toxin-antitoxin system death-on-curing family toxin [Actinomycetota bacterium]